MDSNSKNQHRLSKAHAILTDINSPGYMVPRDKQDTETQSHSPGRKEVKPRKSKVAILYIDEIGWNPKTETFFAHFRIKGRTYTRNTQTKTLEDAKKWLRNHKVSLTNHQKSGVIPGLTLQEGIDLWVSTAPFDKTRKKCPGLQRAEKLKEKWMFHILGEHGNRCISSLGEDFLHKLVDRYETEPGPSGAHNPGGLRNFIIDLNTPFRYWLRQGWVSEIPTLPVIPNIGTPEIHFIPPDRLLEVIELFDRYVRYDIYAMTYIRTMGFAGLRTDNARHLRREFFTLDEGTFDSGITKNGRKYLFPIPEDLKNLLRKIPNMNTPGPLFGGIRGSEVRAYRWCLPLFKRACEDLGIKSARAWHTLRASYATFLLRSGADVVIVKEALGHETLTMILRYAATEPVDLRNAQADGMEFLHARREQRRKAMSAR